MLTSGRGRRAGGIVAPVGDIARCLHGRELLEAGDRRRQVLALARARLFAAEVEAVDVGLRREAAGADEQLLERLARLQLVDAGGVDLALERDQPRLARHRDAHVLLAVDGDDVARRERHVVGLVALQDTLPRLNEITCVVRSGLSRSIVA